MNQGEKLDTDEKINASLQFNKYFCDFANISQVQTPGLLYGMIDLNFP